ncbi:MAG: PadR family transcriptional regulator [Dermatophilaceae bacterium]
MPKKHKHDHDPEFGPGFPFDAEGPRGPRRSREHHQHGSRRGGPGQGENPFEAFLGEGGPFGPRGAFGPRGFFGREGGDVARAIWEAATGAPAAPGFAGQHPQDRTNPAGSTECGEGCGGGHHHGHHDGPHADRGERPGRGERRRRGPFAEGPAFAEDGPRGPFAGPRGRGPRGGGRRGGPRRPRGDVRLAALLLIAEEPRNGYQVIEELSVRTNGVWRPSPGAVYPALAQLEDEGLIEATETDGRKAFTLTDAGRSAVDEAQDTPRPWETATADASEALGGRPGGQMWEAFGQTAMAARAVAATRDPAALADAARVLDDARRSLYRILADGPQDAEVQDAPSDTEAGGAEDAQDD